MAMPHSHPCSSYLHWCSSQATSILGRVELGLLAFIFCLVATDISYTIHELLFKQPSTPEMGLHLMSKCLNAAYWLICVDTIFVVLDIGFIVSMGGMITRSRARTTSKADGRHVGTMNRAKRGRHPLALNRTRKEVDPLERKPIRCMPRKKRTCRRCRRSCINCRFDEICEYMEPRGAWVSVRWIRGRLDSMGRKALDHMLTVGWLEGTPCGRYCRAYPKCKSPREQESRSEATDDVPAFNIGRDDAECQIDEWDIDSCEEFLHEDAPPIQDDDRTPSVKAEECSSECSWELCESSYSM